jgi:hypothetical protein
VSWWRKWVVAIYRFQVSGRRVAKSSSETTPKWHGFLMNKQAVFQARGGVYTE